VNAFLELIGQLLKWWAAGSPMSPRDALSELSPAPADLHHH
jgi:hypothetical protein